MALPGALSGRVRFVSAPAGAALRVMGGLREGVGPVQRAAGHFQICSAPERGGHAPGAAAGEAVNTIMHMNMIDIEVPS